MRVIAGNARSIVLDTPEGLKTRPTTDRIKETLFNMINFDLPGCCFLDLFSGSGAIGIEALSRGANEAIFIEKEVNALNCINENLKRTNFCDKANVINGDVLDNLKKMGQKGKKFDIIFMDPPYKADIVEKVLTIINDYLLLSEDGYIIIERETGKFQPKNNEFEIYKEKIFKTTTMTFLQKYAAIQEES